MITCSKLTIWKIQKSTSKKPKQNKNHQHQKQNPKKTKSTCNSPTENHYQYFGNFLHAFVFTFQVSLKAIHAYGKKILAV